MERTIYNPQKGRLETVEIEYKDFGLGSNFAREPTKFDGTFLTV